MAEHEFQMAGPTDSNYATNIAKSNTIIEEGPKICPLCSSVLRKYFIDFFSKILMCTNMECEYPFGTDYVIYKDNEEEALRACRTFGVDLSRIPLQQGTSVRSWANTSTVTGTLDTNSVLSRGTLDTRSIMSKSDWSEVTPSTQTYDSDDNASMTSSKIFTRKVRRLTEKRAKKKEAEDRIKKTIEKIKECNKIIYEKEEKPNQTIHNEKWIRNLSTLESASGERLVNDYELQTLKKAEEKDNICPSELKIDIDTKSDSMSSIVIAIGNPCVPPPKQT